MKTKIIPYIVGFITGALSIIASNNKPSIYIVSIMILLLIYTYTDITRKEKKKDDIIR